MRSNLWVACMILIAGWVAGCKKEQPPTPPTRPTPSIYFRTPFQSESQYVLESVITDVAEQTVYAASHRLPDMAQLRVAATERVGPPTDAPAYNVQINLGGKLVSAELSVNGPVWSPALYDKLANELAGAAGLSPGGHAGHAEDSTFLLQLTDGTPETIEQQDQELSKALEKDFCNPELHEKAALLLGAFLLRDHSGYFFEIRSPLSRLAAHLIMARFLRNGEGYGSNGLMAEAALLTLIGDQVPALDRLNTAVTNNPSVAAIVRALRARNTGDYRLLDRAGDRSRLERVAWFCAKSDYVGTDLAWPKLNEGEKQTIDFARAANSEGYSVEIGHELLAVSLPLELQEISRVYDLSKRKKLEESQFVSVLNELPEYCFSQSGAQVQVNVIGWGQWALFLQRHLCHAVQQNFEFMQRMWGVPDQAKEFAAQCDRQFNGLRLYPFVRRFNCTDVETYHRSVDDGIKVTVETPQLVPAACWSRLLSKPYFAQFYLPIPNARFYEWHSHNPPPGTVYDLNPRLNRPGRSDNPDPIEHFEKLHELAPYDCRVSNFILATKFHDRPTYAQAMAYYGPVLPYTVFALRTVANTVYGQPEEYEKLMLQAAELSPVCFYDLADFAWDHQQQDKAAQYVDKACAADPDAVRVASHAVWRVRYYLNKGQTDKARQIADEAAEVYSYTGLESKGIFLEAITNYEGAFDWFAKIEERYNKSSPLIDFCLRHKSEPGGQRWDDEIQKRISKIFPKGIEKVVLSDFNGRPPDGVLVVQQNDLLKSAGLKAGDVIVALYGIRVHNFQQYCYARESSKTPELDLVVWQGDSYHQFKPSPPHHRFGVEFGDYPAK